MFLFVFVQFPADLFIKNIPKQRLGSGTRISLKVSNSFVILLLLLLLHLIGAYMTSHLQHFPSDETVQPGINLIKTLAPMHRLVHNGRFFYIGLAAGPLSVVSMRV